MSILLVLAFLFVIGSVVGYIAEVIFRKVFCHEKHWINPGFLVGPYEPLYGFGLIILFFISRIDFTFVASKNIQITFEIVLMAISLTILEYITGLIFVKGLKIKLWDYSDRWGNVQGIICPVYSFLWTAIAIIYYFFINPHIISAITWFTNNLTFSFVIGFVFGLLFIDLCYTIDAVAKIKKFAKEHNILVRYTALKESIARFNKHNKELIHKIMPFGFSGNKLKEKLDYYKQSILAKHKSKDALDDSDEEDIVEVGVEHNEKHD